MGFIPSAALRAGTNYDIEYRMGGEPFGFVADSATNRLKADSPEGLAGEAEGVEMGEAI